MPVPFSRTFYLVILATIALSSWSCGTTIHAKQDSGMTGPTKHDPTDKGESNADYWTPERMRDAEPLPLPTDNGRKPRRQKPPKETPGQADSRPTHRPAEEPKATEQ